MNTSTAVLVGLLASTVVSALSVVLAFARPTLRFARYWVLNHKPTFPDQLCAGIWTSAVGAAIIASVGIWRLMTGDFDAILASLAWVGIAAGYFLHFTAWRSSMTDGRSSNRFAIIYALGLLILAGVVALVVRDDG